MAHAWNGCSQSSRFLPQARRIVGSGDENEFAHAILVSRAILTLPWSSTVTKNEFYFFSVFQNYVTEH